ncbi:MAG: hypothetical protein JWM11_1903 [Planctomycetaceae bacterium]|nr:hypothetical protein [Planctomycetaceae bacterium]
MLFEISEHADANFGLVHLPKLPVDFAENGWNPTDLEKRVAFAPTARLGLVSYFYGIP